MTHVSWKLTTRDKEEIRYLRASGVSGKVVAERFGISAAAVRYHCQPSRAPQRRCGKLSDQQKQELLALREEGLSVRALASRFGISTGAVSWRCLIAGAEPPNRNRFYRPAGNTPQIIKRGGHVVRSFTRGEDEVLLAMESQGASYSVIGRALGRRSNVIRARLATLARHDAYREGSV